MSAPERNSRTMSAGEADTLNWNFSAPLEAISEDAVIQGSPSITIERKTGNADPVISQIAVDSTGKIVSALVSIPASAVNGHWKLIATAATSASRAYSTSWKIVQA